MSKCSLQVFTITRYLHILSIIVIIIGTILNAYASFEHTYTGLWLPIALAIMIVLRLPNQICVAHEQPDGWLSVVGSVAGMIGYIATVIIIVYTYHKNTDDDNDDNNSKKGASTLLGLNLN
jgi:lysylphosphatidylglycerol synthetase-like protein (DUF2156 family)